MGIPLRKKTIVIIIVTLMVVGGGLAAALVYFNLQLKAQQDTIVEVKKPVVAQTICSDDILKQAATAMAYPQDSAKLTTIATDIMANANYGSDVNCLYVVLQYNLAFSQAADARTNLNSLKALYNSAIGYSDIIKDVASPPQVLEKMVTNLETTQKDFVEKNDFTGVKDEQTN